MQGRYWMKPTSFKDALHQELSFIEQFLLEKNNSYGNSALEPVKIFAKTISAVDQINVRIDDKLNRLIKGTQYRDDDTVLDLLGYLILKRIAERECFG